MPLSLSNINGTPGRSWNFCSSVILPDYFLIEPRTPVKRACPDELASKTKNKNTDHLLLWLGNLIRNCKVYTENMKGKCLIWKWLGGGGDKEECPRKIFIRALRGNPARESKTLVPRNVKPLRPNLHFCIVLFRWLQSRLPLSWMFISLDPTIKRKHDSFGSLILDWKIFRKIILPCK